MKSIWVLNQDNITNPEELLSGYLPGVEIKSWLSAAKPSILGHHPYSNYRVGAAALSKNGDFRFGTNVEDASFGGTICAERTSITRMVSEGLLGKENPLIGMALNTEPRSVPCGHCFSLMLEFMPSNGNFVIVSSDSKTNRVQLLDIEVLRSLIWSSKYLV